MFVALWEYEVKPGSEERFETVYGPAGAWARLFGSDANYRETRLLHDAFRSAMYLTVDFWKSREAYEEFMRTHKDEYERLDAVGGGLTMEQRLVGWYEKVGP